MGAGGYDVLVIKLDLFGNMMWAKTYGGPYTDKVYSAQLDANDGCTIAGYTSSHGAGKADFLVIALYSDGSIPDCPPLQPCTLTVNSVSPIISDISPSTSPAEFGPSACQPSCLSVSPTTTVICEAGVEIIPSEVPEVLKPDVVPTISVRRWTIKYEIPKSHDIEELLFTLKIYNTAGKLIKVLVEHTLPAGRYATDWNGKDENLNSVPPGIYYCKLRANNMETKKNNCNKIGDFYTNEHREVRVQAFKGG